MQAYVAAKHGNLKAVGNLIDEGANNFDLISFHAARKAQARQAKDVGKQTPRTPGVG